MKGAVDKTYVLTYANNVTTISATNARNNLYDLIEEVSSSGKRVGITRKGETKAVLISPEELSSWEATIETLADRELMDAIREGDEDIKAGRYVSLEEVDKELGLKHKISNVSGKLNSSGKKGPKKAR